MKEGLFDPPGIIRSVDALTELAGRINAEHQQAENALREGLSHAKNAGELLLKAKAQCGHGNWLSWLKTHVTFTDRTARRYMTLASRWQELTVKSDTVSDLTCRRALNLLTSPTADEEEPKAQRAADLPSEDDPPYPDRCPLADDEVIWIGRHGFHCPFAGICSDLTGPKWHAFVESVRLSGIRQAIILDDNLDVIDGRQRLRAAAELGLPLDAVPLDIQSGLSDEAKLALYEDMNLVRHHRLPSYADG